MRLPHAQRPAQHTLIAVPLDRVGSFNTVNKAVMGIKQNVSGTEGVRPPPHRAALAFCAGNVYGGEWQRQEIL
jgi:hypothetical protein